MHSRLFQRSYQLFLMVPFLLSAPLVLADARIMIVNADPPGEGLNDPTPRDPVGGNAGTTLGEQRLNVAHVAAKVWGRIVTSDVEMRVSLSYSPISCGAFGNFDFPDYAADFPGAIFPNTWYPPALANKLAGYDLFPGQPHVLLVDNSDYDAGNCPGSRPMYYGFDGQAGTGLDMLAANVRQIAHGLGFYNLVDAAAGTFYQGKPDVFTHFVFDTTMGLTWAEMTRDQLRASAANFHNVVWNGPEAPAAVPCFLQQGAPSLVVHTDDDTPRGDLTFDVLRSLFGAPLQSPGVSGRVVSVGLGCDPYYFPSSRTNLIVLADRGVCTAVDKVRNAQNAGAHGLILASNIVGASPATLTGVAPDISIPSLGISMSDGDQIKRAMDRRRVTATLGLDPSRRAGTDSEGRILLWTPIPAGSGPDSAGGYWDLNVTPSLLVMPVLPPDLPPIPGTVDITPQLLRDIGW